MLQKKYLVIGRDSFDKNLKKKLKELDSCLNNQSKFSQTILKLIDNLEFDDTDSKEQEKETTKDDSSLSENNNDDENNSTSEDKNQQNKIDLNIAETDLESLNQDENLNEKEAKEVAQNPNLRNDSRKNYQKKNIEYIQMSTMKLKKQKN